MRPFLITFVCLCSALAYVSAVPVPASNQELDVLQIPLENGKELDVLTLGNQDQEQLIAERNKRTIGLLRDLFPDITKQIDDIANRIIGQVIRVLGPEILPLLLNSNRNSSPRPSVSDGFGDDDEDDDDDDFDKDGNGDNKIDSSSPKSSKSNDDDDLGSRVKIDLPTFPSDTSSENVTPESKVSSATTTNAPSPTATSSTSSITTSTTTSTTVRTTTTSPKPTTTTTITTPMPTSSTTSTTSTTSPPTTTTIIPSTSEQSSSTSTTDSPIYIVPKSKSSSKTTDFPNNTTILITPNPPISEPKSQPVARSFDVSSTSLNMNALLNNDRVVDETQLMAIVESLNRLLNSTNYFVANRDNLSVNSSSTSTTTPTTRTTTVTETTTSTASSLAIPTAPNGATDTQIDLSAINKQLEETIRVARQVQKAEAAAQAPYQLPIPTPKVEETIQLSFNNELNASDKPATSVSNELNESKSPAIDELTLDSNEDTADLDDRNKSNVFKRFLQFGGAGLAGGASGGSATKAGGVGGAGSGNFLFDIVRLFSGSVQTQAGDESANSVSGSVSVDGDSDSDSNRSADGYTEGIPGPVTRLVVLANRGLANLVQDLILRVAATSEKFVNFKAKLITALI